MPTIIIDKPNSDARISRRILEEHTSRGGIFIDADRAAEYRAHFIKESRPKLKELRLVAGDPEIYPTENKQIASLLVNKMKVSEHFLKNDQNAISVEADILENLLNLDISEQAREFVTILLEIKKNLHRASYLKQYLDCPLLNARSFEGHRMRLAKPEWNILSTSRISAKKPSVQNILKELADIFTYPPDWLMVFSDSGQIEPRITYSHFVKDPVIKYLIELYDDAYYGQMHYIYMDDAEYAMAYKNLSSIHKKELTKDDRQLIKRILLMGQYGSQMSDVDVVLTNRFQKRIMQNPFKMESDAKAREMAKLGHETTYSAFGTPITPEETDRYKKGTRAWEGHIARCFINNPVQTTASDCMNEAVMRMDSIMRTQAKLLANTFIGYAKHDEILAYLSPKDHDLAPLVQDCMSYDITLNGERWIPIRSDLHIGKKEGSPKIAC